MQRVLAVMRDERGPHRRGMSQIQHRTVETNGIRMHIAEQGAGPPVVLCHGFPESWYSWRHQLSALGEAGFYAVAPDMRGYGQTDRPEAIDQYTLLHLVGDMVGLLDALGAESAVIAGHDWGAPVAWHAALLRPDRFRAVIGLSVPYRPRTPVRPTTVMPQTDDALFYQLYFQEPGVAEAELERDVRSTIRRLAYSGSGDVPRHDATFANPDAVGMVPRRGGFLSRTVAERAAILAHRGGHRFLCRGVLADRLPRRAELVPQHRPQLGAARALRRRAGDRPRPLRRGRPGPRRRLPRHGPAHPESLEVRPQPSQDHHARWLRSLDPAGTAQGGQCRDARLPQGPVDVPLYRPGAVHVTAVRGRIAVTAPARASNSSPSR